MVDYDIERRIRPYLGPQERIVWTGKPPSGFVFRAEDGFLIPFSLIWTTFVVLWELAAISTGTVFFIAWGVPFLAVGAHMLVGRFFVDAWRRARTVYGLSETTAYILRGDTATTINLANTPGVQAQHLGRPRGTLTFPANAADRRMARTWPGFASGHPQFFRVAQADYAFRIIQAART